MGAASTPSRVRAFSRKSAATSPSFWPWARPAWVRERFLDVDPEPVDIDTCLYTKTADETFVLDCRGNVVVGSAWSGHGFKFAPAVGRRLAALALE